MSSRTVGGQEGGDLTNGVASKPKLVASPGNLVDILKTPSGGSPPPHVLELCDSRLESFSKAVGANDAATPMCPDFVIIPGTSVTC